MSLNPEPRPLTPSMALSQSSGISTMLSPYGDEPDPFEYRDSSLWRELSDMPLHPFDRIAHILNAQEKH